MEYKRIPGGEKTKKTGTVWKIDELLKVYYLYKDLNGIGIHERNPKIQILAKELGRSVRSTEMQLLMYRALDKGLAYSRKNMNRNCEIIWNNNKLNGDMTNNDFVKNLLDLQQDGKMSISAPTNWINYSPILEVYTEVDSQIDNLKKFLLRGKEENSHGLWHFFVGSPGNGKSAAIGRLCRNLIKDNACEITDEDGININELEKTRIPYALYVYEKGNKFPSLLIVQDASVVRDPFVSEIDPAKELVETLKFAWEKGLSLVICTNRGILEKAYIDNHMNYKINKQDWFKVINKVISRASNFSINSNESKKAVFKTIKIDYSFLDNKSLLIKSKTFEDLIIKATAPENWLVCDKCANTNLCPFKANRDWIYDEEGREKILKLFKRVEVLSGQTIVFREALAIISLILAGCPVDYKAKHPCEWVNNKIREDDIFSLGARRIYMILFASYYPWGFEFDDSLRARQFKFFSEFIGNINKENCPDLVKLVNLNNQSPSTDVGVHRILGREGILSQLDPLRDILPKGFFEDYDTDYDNIEKIVRPPFFTLIEKLLIATWKQIEDRLEHEADILVSEGNWALKRWSSNFLLHLGIMYEGLTLWNTELDEFASLLSIVGKQASEREISEKQKLKIFEKEFNGLLNSDEDATSLKLSDTFRISGTWIQENLKPSIIENNYSGSVSLSIRFEGGEESTISALMYVWLNRKSKGNLHPLCFPQKLMVGIKDARIRAAAKSDYAYVNNDIEFVVNDGEKDLYRITRIDGEPVIEKV